MKIVVTPQAQKDFDRLPRSAKNKIEKRLVALESQPYLGKKLEGNLSDRRSVRAWPYRIIYLINQQVLFAVSITHRQGAYKK
jgi:addiction module RelE/StbE family toxin